MTLFSSTITPSTISERATDETVVLDDGRVGLHRFEHTADADAAGKVDVFADLGAGTDSGPGVDHGAFIDIGPDIDEGRAS